MPRQRAAQPRYRRRVVLEITPEESTLLDRLADRHGTIRGAVMAGLRGLEADRSPALEAQIRRLTARLSTATQAGLADRDHAAAELVALKGQLTASEQNLTAEQAKAVELRGDLRETRGKLSREQAARKAADQARRIAEVRLTHHAYCATCDKLVPEAEWAEQAWGNGFAIYHRPHGFREKTGVLGRPASLLFWRAHSIAGARP